MHPEKEGRHVLQRLITMWGYYTDGWAFRCTWQRNEGRRELHAEHPEDGSATGHVTRTEWEDFHHSAVDEVAEAMYLATFV